MSKPGRRFRDTAKGRNPNALLLIALYRDGEHRIGELVREVISGRRAARRIRIAIQGTVRALERRTPGLVRRAIRTSYTAGESALHGRKRSGRRLSALDTRTAEVLIDNLTLRLVGAARMVGRRADDALREAALQAALRQVEAEAPMGQAADDLERQFRRRGVTAFVDRRGRQWRLSTYAEMAVRTTSAEALARGTVEKMAEFGFDLVEVSSHGCSHHPGDPSHPCVTLEGETLSITGATPGYERLPRFPLHPNCEHFITPSPLAFEVSEPELVAA